MLTSIKPLFLPFFFLLQSSINFYLTNLYHEKLIEIKIIILKQQDMILLISGELNSLKLPVAQIYLIPTEGYF